MIKLKLGDLIFPINPEEIFINRDGSVKEFDILSFGTVLKPFDPKPISLTLKGFFPIIHILLPFFVLIVPIVLIILRIFLLIAHQLIFLYMVILYLVLLKLLLLNFLMEKKLIVLAMCIFLYSYRNIRSALILL